MESFWRAVGADFGMSGFCLLSVYLLIENVSPEPSILDPDPSETLNLGERFRFLPWSHQASQRSSTQHRALHKIIMQGICGAKP